MVISVLAVSSGDVAPALSAHTDIKADRAAAKPKITHRKLLKFAHFAHVAHSLH